MSDENIHGEHRKRMRSRYMQFGADAFETHQLLEMLLFNSIPREDTNPAAHKLLDTFSSRQLLSADINEMKSVHGIGEKSANLVRISIDTTVRLLIDNLAENPMNNDFIIRLYLYLCFSVKSERYAMAVFLNKKKCIISSKFIARGKLFRSDDYVGETVKLAKSQGAAGVIICHNHSNNVEEPSVEDYCLTMQFSRELEANGIEFLGHYIATGSNCVKVDLS